MDEMLAIGFASDLDITMSATHAKLQRQAERYNTTTKKERCSSMKVCMSKRAQMRLACTKHLRARLSLDYRLTIARCW